MADIAHIVGSDLSVGPTGDLETVDQAIWTQQRIIRRLLTNQGDYIWQLRYGAGLPGMVGSITSAQQLTAIIRQQLGLESTVSTQPEPIVVLQNDQTGNLTANISYKDVTTGVLQALAIPKVN